MRTIFAGSLFVLIITFVNSAQTTAQMQCGWIDGGSTIRLTSSIDKVGIGIPTATEKLHVKGGNIKLEKDGNHYTLYAHNGYMTLIRSYQNSGYMPIVFDQQSGPTATERMRIDANGNVGIGTDSPGSDKLAVNGTIKAKEIYVSLQGWSDFVFKDDYKLDPLETVEKFIKNKKHLKGMPTEKEVLKNGIAMGEMDAKLLQKIEELTLYLIEVKKENNVLRAKIAKIEEKL